MLRQTCGTARRAAMVIALFAGLCPSAATAADGERMMRDVVLLAGTIGPRKTGSDADRRAADYVRAEMEKAGLQATLQEVGRLEAEEGERVVGSWNVLGVLPGDSPATILVAAHHDTHSAVVPGANDDASGVAVLLETARAVAARPRRVSYLFASFCAEEEGLLGSAYFARHADLGRIRAAVALELLGRGEIVVGPVPGPPPGWAMRALLRAAGKSGVRSIGERPIWALVPRFVTLDFSSDHETFLQEGIPAFLMMGTFPAWRYHTPEDALIGIRRDALVRAADVLDRLLRDLETRPLSRDRGDPHDLPFVAFGRGLVVPGPALTGLAIAGLAAALGLLLARLRAALRVRALAETIRVVLVAGTSTALGLAGPFGAAELMETLHGRRHPWMAAPSLHLAFLCAAGLLTGWLGLKLFRRIKPTVEPGPYLGAALLLPVAATVAALRAGRPEIAAILALPAVTFVLSLGLRSVGRKLALGWLGGAPLLFLMTPDDLRAAVDLGGIEVPDRALLAAGFVLLLPFVLFVAHVASFQDCLHSRVWWWLSGPRIGGAALLATLALGIGAWTRPAYSASWRQLVRVRQDVDLDRRRATLLVRSHDRLDGIRFDGLPGRAPDAGSTIDRFDLTFPEETLHLEAALLPAPEPGLSVCTVGLRAPRTPDRVSYLFTSRAGFRLAGTGGPPLHRYTITDVAPPRDPERQVHLELSPSADLELNLRAEFAEDLLGVRPRADGWRVFTHRGTVTASRRLAGPADRPR